MYKCKQRNYLYITTALFLYLFYGISAASAAESILYSFKDSPDGALPSAGLIADGAGGFFGVTERGGTGSCPIKVTAQAAGCGAVFRLIPPAKGATGWTEKILYSFKGHADGAIPVFGTLRVAGDVLYGTTVNGGTGACAETQFSPAGCGTVFKLSPPGAGKSNWTESVIYSFKGGADGSAPGGPLIAGKGGVLYGATISGGLATCKALPAAALLAGCGIVFALKPPAAGKTLGTETILYKFKGGKDGSRPGHSLIADAAGALYGATEYGGTNICPDTTQPGCGTVFKLAPPAAGKAAWSESIIHDFKGGTADGDYPQTSLIFNSAGALFGTTSAGGSGTCTQPGSKAKGCGTIFRLLPPASGKTVWIENILRQFRNTAEDGSIPVNGVVADSAGVLYGTTGSAGGPSIVYKLTPPPKGKEGWTEASLYSFKLGGTDGFSPVGTLILGSTEIYGTTLLGGKGCVSCGTVFSVTK